MENLTIKSLEQEISEILAPYRAIAEDYIVQVMAEAFRDISDLLHTEEKSADIVLQYDSSVSGIWPSTLRDIHDLMLGEDRAEVLLHSSDSATVQGYMLEFLNFAAMRRNIARSNNPKAFSKWSESDDRDLERMWSEHRPWSEISRSLGRGTNALKLRLEHLGHDLGPDSGHSIYK